MRQRLVVAGVIALLVTGAIGFAGGCALDENGLTPDEGGVAAPGIDSPVAADVALDSLPPADAGDAAPSDGAPADGPGEASDPCLGGTHYFCPCGQQTGVCQ